MGIETLQLAHVGNYLDTPQLGEKTQSQIASFWESRDIIVCDFENVYGMTRRFADSAFGDMFIEKGSAAFTEKVRFFNLNELVEVILKCTLYVRYESMKGGRDLWV